MLLERLKILFSVKESPERIAISFSTGVFIGISPLLGLHTILSIVVASVFRLNTLVTLAGTYITNPWTLVPVYVFCTWVGVKLIGQDVSLEGLQLSHLTVFNIFKTLKGLFWPFVFGTTVVAFLAAFISYWVVLYLLRRFRKV